MNEMLVQINVAAGGKTFNGTRALTSNWQLNAPAISLAAGKAGTAGADGVMTLASGHGITDADVVSVAWTASGVAKFRYGCTVSAYTSTTITLTGGTGDTLPTSGDVVVGVRAEQDVAFDGDGVVLIAVNSTKDIAVDFNTGSASALLLSITGGAGVLGYEWDEGCGVTNPLASASIAKVYLYNKIAAEASVDLCISYDNVA